MIDFIQFHQFQTWKPILTALLLPPVPLLVLIVFAALLLPTRRRLGWLLIAFSVSSLWLSSTSGGALVLAQASGLHPPPLSAQRVAEVARQVARSEPAGAQWAIVVLGGGSEPTAPEYAAASLSDESLQRLRYGLWLARLTAAPLAFSGGRGWAADPDGKSEAGIAAQIATEQFAQQLRWAEDQSRDTRQNATQTIKLMHAAGIGHLLLVTNGGHMRRSLRAFQEAVGTSVAITAAPMGLAYSPDHGLLQWLPSGSGASRFRQVLREVVGLLVGA